MKEETKTITSEEAKQIQFLNSMEYQSKFMLDPAIEGDVDFGHLDKNLAITNLKHNPKLKINEPELARAILRALHILNNPKHYKEKTKEVLTGYQEVTKKDRIIKVPVYHKVKVQVPKFPKTFHKLKSEFISLVNTSASREGFRMKAARSNILVKETSLEDKTQSKSRWKTGSKKDY